MASLTQWTWVWVDLGVGDGQGGLAGLWFMGSQRVGHDRVTELNMHIHEGVWAAEDRVQALVD